MNGRRGIMKNRGILWRKRGANEGYFWVKEGENDDFAIVFSHEINRISEYKKGNSSEDLDRGMRPSRVFKSQHFLAIKFVP